MPPALDRTLPAWLDWATRAAVCLVAGGLLTGMALAMAGVYRPPAARPLALLAAAGLLWLAPPRPPPPGPRPRAPPPPRRAGWGGRAARRGLRARAEPPRCCRRSGR